ncbi:hypothetical protein [Oricola thermophila]|uniref:Surface antigen domain-containing protein n=1 Tax=Oricola thermophila TaxID=2742145 RepID=A0A6N1VNU3_9HYPH|nr:hypothetical protein [Oricola thermophila]QKV20607.1 hypothetical protein HTY61_09245 [Oricola thermophila]
MRTGKLALAAILAFAVAGCSTGAGTNVPDLAFSAFPRIGESSEKLESTTLVSALNGGIIDRGIHDRMDPATRNKALQAEYQALEYTPAGEAVAWGNPGGRFSGQVVASQPYRVGSQDCRQYSHTVVAGGTPVTNRGTACRNPDGSWTPLT